MTPVLRWSNGSRLSRHERERERKEQTVNKISRTAEPPPSCWPLPFISTFPRDWHFSSFFFLYRKKKEKNLLRLDHHFIHPLWLFFALSHSFSTFGHSFRRCPSIFFFSPKTKMQAEMRPKGGKFSLSFWLHLHRRKILRLNSRAARSVIIFNRERRTFSFFAGCLWGFAPMGNWR